MEASDDVSNIEGGDKTILINNDINEKLLCEYIEWIDHKRMTAVGLPCPYKVASNPLPWTQKWIAGGDVQVAPQEVELSSYISGGTKQDVDQNSFAGFKL